MIIYTILQRTDNGTQQVKESFMNWDKAVITCGMYNRDKAKDEYYYIKENELDESDDLTTERDGSKVFIVDDNDNSIEVTFTVDQDGDFDDLEIQGSDLSMLDLSKELQGMIFNSVLDAIENMIEESANNQPDSIYDI